jgi:hypothetical protein
MNIPQFSAFLYGKKNISSPRNSRQKNLSLKKYLKEKKFIKKIPRKISQTKKKFRQNFSIGFFFKKSFQCDFWPENAKNQKPRLCPRMRNKAKYGVLTCSSQRQKNIFTEKILGF